MSERYDVVVSGGGPVGAAFALGLQDCGLNVAVLEARETASPVNELKPLALSYGSRLILERLGVWPALTPATSIDRIHISQRGRFGRTELTAAGARLPALGYVVDYAGLVSALDAALARSAVTVVQGVRVTTLAHDTTSARVEFDTQQGTRKCCASLVAIADGSAAAADVGIETREYGQSALTARLDAARPQQHDAYERFTPDGPIALLPFDRGYALVWTMPSEAAARWTTATPEAFLAHLYASFGERLGRFHAVSARSQHRLALRVARRTTWGRAVLIGNAAQALHPVAGQGFNLGLRDAWELAAAIKRYGPSGSEVLERYRAHRRIDRAGGIAFTDTLVRLFSNDLAPLAIARGAGLVLLDCIPPAKDWMVRRMVFGARG
jgi:2-octaprenyl-6-methoxyphenol hydroxylase